MIFNLSRQLVIDKIDHNLPPFIIDEIIESHGITNENEQTIEEKVIAIQNSEVPKIKISISSDLIKLIYPDIDENSFKFEMENKTKFKKITMSYLARFINPNSLWNIKSLVRAFEFFLLFTINDKDKLLTYLPKDLTFGQQTMSSIQSLNYCMCYKICKLFEINVNGYTTKNQIENAVKYLRYNEHALKSFVKSMSKIDLINAIIISNLNIDLESKIEDKITPQILEKSYKNLTDIKFLQSEYIPQSNKDAVTMAAIRYGINLSNLKIPIDEFEILNRSSDYKPRDEWMKKWYDEDPIQFDLHHQFSPNFPSCFYKKIDLERYLMNEGCSLNLQNKKLNELYELSKEYYKYDSFHEYKQPNMLTDETLDLDDIHEIEKNMIICWGSKQVSTIPLTAQEVYHCFVSFNKCVNPTDTKAKLPEHCIRKLKAICKKNEKYDIYQKLSDRIIYYETLDQTTDNLTLDFVAKYKESDLILDGIYLILEIGMYMRGWRRNEEYQIKYPLTKEECTLSPEEEPIVEVNTIDSIARYKYFKEQNPEIADVIEALPLILYYKGHFEKSNDKDTGKTILERMQIIEKGFYLKTQDSCIRVSSNYFLSSAYKYIVLMKQIVPFEISKMDLLLN